MTRSAELPQPDKDFFEGNPRSALLRNICIQAIQASEHSVASEGTSEEAFRQLLDANRKLTELGIEPGMHTMAADDPNPKIKQEEMLTNPVIAAEWLSGQMRNLIINTAAMSEASQNRIALLEEHDELLGQGEGAFVADSAIVAPKTQPLGMIGLLSTMLDADAGPSDLKQK